MNESANNRGCGALMEACTLELYQRNIFRVTGMPVDATSKEVSRQAQKLQMLEGMGDGSTGSRPAFPLAVAPTTDEIRAALSRMQEPENRMVDEFFWYWPEEFGASKTDPAIQAMLAGDTEGAVRLWRDREKNGSRVAQHNMAILYHMYAVDWTNYHVSFDIDQSLDEQIKGYWRKSFERWEELVDADYIWDMMKERVRSLGDEALTTGFVRRMLKQLPQALDRVNADAALELAEQGRLDWARFHVDFMNETHQGLDDVESTSDMVLAPTKTRVKQHLTNYKERTEKDPKRGTVFAAELLSLCRPMMDLFDLFHGEDAHQRNDLFDEVAETVVGIADVDWGANKNAQRILPIFKTALELATGIHLRGRIIKEISDIEGLVAREKLAPIFQALEEINDSKDKSGLKLEKINNQVLPKLPELSQEYGHQSEAISNLCDSIAIVLKGVAVAAHNDAKDFKTAEAAIQLAFKLAVDQKLKERISDDIVTLTANKQNSMCFFCGTQTSDASSVFDFAMHGDVVRHYKRVEYRKLSIPIERCKTCKQKQNSAETLGCVAGIVCLVIGIAIGAAIDSDGWIGGAMGGGIAGLIVSAIISRCGSRGLNDPKKHPRVIEMRGKGWIIGASPR